MNMTGIKTLQTINGTETIEVEGQYAGEQVRIYTTNPFGTPKGTIRHIYKVSTETDGLLRPKKGGDVTVDILDPAFLAVEFNGIPYTELIGGVKAFCEFIAERDQAPIEEVDNDA